MPTLIVVPLFESNPVHEINPRPDVSIHDRKFTPRGKPVAYTVHDVTTKGLTLFPETPVLGYNGRPEMIRDAVTRATANACQKWIDGYDQRLEDVYKTTEEQTA